jgi:hypothetical protein
MVNAPSEKQAAIESYFWDIFPFFKKGFSNPNVGSMAFAEAYRLITGAPPAKVAAFG